jgi:hypothetical protein
MLAGANCSIVKQTPSTSLTNKLLSVHVPLRHMSITEFNADNSPVYCGFCVSNTVKMLSTKTIISDGSNE